MTTRWPSPRKRKKTASLPSRAWLAVSRLTGLTGFCHGGGVSSAEPHRRVAIVGGGIAGLAAAYFLQDRGAAVTVLEASPRMGGKLAVSEVAGIAVDAGAEALLARRTEGVDLICSVGLGPAAGIPGYHDGQHLDQGPVPPAAQTAIHGSASRLR